MSSFTVPLPSVSGPIPVTDRSHPFSTFRTTREPIDLAGHGYLEEEYFLSGEAHSYPESVDPGRVVAMGEAKPYRTRVLVRRPADHPSPTVWLSILNASQGYDIEDDWRRAWDEIIGRGDTYVGLTAKPISVDALQQYDPQRYASLSFGGPTPGLVAAPGWNPFQVINTADESLAWELIAQTARWIRTGQEIPRPEQIILTGQSQSGVYTNTYLTHFHQRLRGPEGEALLDGYLPGAASVLTRSVAQSDQGVDARLEPVFSAPADIDVPVITISTDGDVELFSDFGRGAAAFRTGDGPLRRHWHVAGTPHSDARSRVIPDDSVILQAQRLPRRLDQAALEALDVVPVEPAISAAMEAIVRWIRDGVAAAPSVWFDVDAVDPDRFVTGPFGVRAGGIRYGLVEHPLAEVQPAATDNPVLGSMSLLPRAEILTRYPDFETWRAACDEVDDALEASGHLTSSGRQLLHAVERELWQRAVEASPAPTITPQQIGSPALHG